MAVKINKRSLRIGYPHPHRDRIPVDNFRPLLTRNIASDPFTRYLEDIVAKYVENGFSEDQTQLIARLVCAWGGLGRGSPKRLYNQNIRDSFQGLTEKFRKACCYATNGQAANAIKALDDIHGTGLSFRSKFLRMMCPDHAVVLDSIIRGELGYKHTTDGYSIFVSDCIKVRDALNGNNKPNDSGNRWRVSEVEMALFRHSLEQKEKKKQREH